MDIQGQSHNGHPLKLMIGTYRGLPKVHIGTDRYFTMLTASPTQKMTMKTEPEHQTAYAGNVLPFEALEAITEQVAGACLDFIL